jgi:hypothetical protein
MSELTREQLKADQFIAQVAGGRALIVTDLDTGEVIEVVPLEDSDRTRRAAGAGGLN